MAMNNPASIRMYDENTAVIKELSLSLRMSSLATSNGPGKNKGMCANSAAVCHMSSQPQMIAVFLMIVLLRNIIQILFRESPSYR